MLPLLAGLVYNKGLLICTGYLLHMDNPLGGTGYLPGTASPQWEGSWWVRLLTPANLILVAVFMVVVPLVLLTGESFVISLLEAFQVLNLNAETVVRSTLPWQYYLKLAVFTVFALGLLGYLLLQITLQPLIHWATTFSRPDPLHVDFSPSPQASVGAVSRWTFHRMLVIALPPLLLVALSIGFGVLGLSIMNTVVDLATIALPSAITMFMFIGLMLGVVTALTCANGLWLMVTTVFGDVATLAEPDLPPRFVFDRVRRIAFCSPLVWVLYPSVLLFWAFTLWAIIALLVGYDVSHVLQWTLPWPVVLLVELVLIGAYLVLNYLTLFTYHHALTRYYRQLPPAFRDRFSRPEDMATV